MIQYLLFSLFIHIQGKAISETAKDNTGSDENLQEEDIEYLRNQNVDHHSNAVVNKIIKIDVNKIFN